MKKYLLVLITLMFCGTVFCAEAGSKITAPEGNKAVITDVQTITTDMAELTKHFNKNKKQIAQLVAPLPFNDRLVVYNNLEKPTIATAGISSIISIKEKETIDTINFACLCVGVPSFVISSGLGIVIMTELIGTQISGKEPKGSLVPVTVAACISTAITWTCAFTFLGTVIYPLVKNGKNVNYNKRLAKSLGLSANIEGISFDLLLDPEKKSYGLVTAISLK